jgi:hypothetical protein
MLAFYYTCALILLVCCGSMAKKKFVPRPLLLHFNEQNIYVYSNFA